MTISTLDPKKVTFTPEQTFQASLEYFGGDELAASTAANKYLLKQALDGKIVYDEDTPTAMHRRLAREIAFTDCCYEFNRDIRSIEDLVLESEMAFYDDRYLSYFEAFDRFGQIVPQGSPMYGIGNPYVRVSISNCVVVPSPADNISGIVGRSSQELANLFKRRCGVGIDISTLRPEGTPVNNSAVTSTGAWSFADHFSNVCRMIGQNGRRGALMITMDVRHPDIDRFVTMKRDISKVTGANISIRLTDDFMAAVTSGEDWICRWPVEDYDTDGYTQTGANVQDILVQGGKWVPVPANPDRGIYIGYERWSSVVPGFKDAYLKKFKAAELWHLINESAVLSAEPGLLFWDNYLNNLPAHCYPAFKTICVNPCCFSYNSDVQVVTKQGIKELKDITSDDIIWVDDTQSWHKTSGYFKAGFASLKKVVLSNGEELLITENHKLQRITKKPRSESRELVEVRNLQVGDAIALHVNAPYDLQWGDKGTRGEGLVMGWLSGDGALSFAKSDDIFPTTYLSFWSGEYDVANKIGNVLADEFGLDLKQQQCESNGNTVRRFASSRITAEWQAKYEHNIWRFKNGYNPFLNEASRDFICGYLSSYFSADGTVNFTPQQSRFAIQLTSVDKYRMEQVRNLLLLFGIKSGISVLRAEGMSSFRGLLSKTQTCYRLTITGRDSLGRFRDNIGFVSEVKQEKLSNILAAYETGGRAQCDYVRITAIEDGGQDEVGCIEVEGAHRFTANGIISGNSEIGLSAYDSCRLTSLNLKGFVHNAFKTNAYFDFVAFDKQVRNSMRVMDNIVDLEIRYLTDIIEKVDEPEEFELWTKLREAALQGRRTGLGTHALADALACLGLKYDSEDAIVVVDRIFSTLRDSAYDESVNLAIERGAFPCFDWEREKDCAFIQRLPVEIQERIRVHGRRNISLLTMAPTGSVSIVSQTSSGIEPVFSNFYMRRKKINPSDVDARVDFVDQNGDKWAEFTVFHHNILGYMKENEGVAKQIDAIMLNVEPSKRADEIAKVLPAFFVTAPEIDAMQRVRIQGTIQQYIDHGISSTLNLPRGTSVEACQAIYEASWKAGLKGVTVYVDGSRSGVLVNMTDKIDPNAIQPSNAPKRPDALPCEIHRHVIDGQKWIIMVGLLGGEPFEIFGGLSENVTVPKKIESGTIIKRKTEKATLKGRNSAYDLVVGDKEDPFVVKDIVAQFDDGDYAAQTRMISLALRHGIPTHFIADQLGRDKEASFFSFSKVMARVLKKYVKDGEESGEKCGVCGAKLVFEDGCSLCRSCGGTNKCG